MTIETGTVVYWRDFVAGQDKFIYILGTNSAQEVLSFTISSQTKYLSMYPHAREMVEIAKGTIDCFDRTCYIQCFYEVRRTPIAEFMDLDRRGFICYRGSLPQFSQAIRKIVSESILLEGYDQDAVLEVLG
jgi:hypothetical protein